MKKFFLFLVLCTFLSIIGFAQTVLKETFKTENIPPTPDYSRSDYWAALPDKKDPADSLPQNKIQLSDKQSTAQADVFFVHPTIFTDEPTDKYVWNASVDDKILNDKTDFSTILNQANVFNGSCKIYAPRYRQAHLYAFYTTDINSAKQAFEVAYSDVKAAFEYYLAHYNNGRPIVIASHSQGTVHAKHLLHDFFDGKPLQKQLVAAYLIGIVTPPNEFTNIPPGTSPGQTGCFMTWRTFKHGYIPDDHFKLGYDKCLSVNPLSWDTTSVLVSRKLHKGTLGYKFTMTQPEIVDAQNYKGMLWIGKLHIPGAFLIKTKNWHVADYNLFWLNIRENVALRIDNFLKTNR